MDVLADLLTRARAQGAVFAHSTMGAPWGLEFRDDLPLSFHAVLEGELHVEGLGAPVRLLQGDVLLVRSGEPYRFLHAPGAPSRRIDELLPTTPAEPRRRLVVDGPGPTSSLLCGAYTFEGSVCDSLLDALPERIVLRAAEVDAPLRSALALLAGEVAQTAPGQQTALDRLLDLLLVLALRTWFRRPDAAPPAWYAALDDPHVGPALRAIHARPAHPWTVASLAAEAGLSRAALARRFGAVAGMPPLAYLTAWRMTLAAEALLRPGATVAAVAHEVGYADEFGFSTAFKRARGVPPGRWRRERLAAAAAA